MKILKKFTRLSVSTQVVLLVIGLVLPVNMISVIYAIQAQQAFVRQTMEAAGHTAALYMNELDERIHAADIYMSNDADENTHTFKLRDDLSDEEFMKVASFYWQELDRRVKNYMEADAYFFCVSDRDYANVAVKGDFNSLRSVLNDYIKTQSRLRVEQPRNIRPEWYCEKIGGTQWAIHLLRYGSSDYCYGAMINLDMIEDRIAAGLTMDHALVAVGPETPCQEEKGTLTVKTTCDRAALEAAVTVERKNVLSQMPVAQKMGISMAIVYLICIPLLIFILKKLLIRPMYRLNQAMSRLEEGDTSYRITDTEKNREMGELNRKFNSMAQRIETLKIQVYEKELERMDIEAMNLRLQVNPHFIMNCLNTIFSLAKSSNVANIRKFTKYLANYLRFSLWHTSGSVQLYEEMRCVHNYVEVQKIRYPGRFTYTENIDESLMGLRLPSLMILNFVENSIKYALKMEDEIEVIVIAREEEGDMVISICDTGNGMDGATLEKIRGGEAFENESGKHIGIWNCRRRLNMLYGERMYFNITSSPGSGTQVFMRIPSEGRGKFGQ